MGARRGRPGGDGRGVSEVVSVVVLLVLVATGAAVVAVTWSTAQTEFEEEARTQSAAVTLQEFDARITEIASRGGPARGAFDLSDRDGAGERVTVERGDELEVWVQNDSGYVPECRATVPLDEVRYRVDEETTMVYQAGGVFRVVDGSATVVTPPAVRVSGGTLSLRAVRLPDDLGGDEFEAERDVAASRRVSQRVMRDLFDGQGCQRPDGVKLVVDSDTPDAWAAHLAAETPSSATVSVDAGAGEVTVELGAAVVGAGADDDRNQVVDFHGSGVAGSVTEHGRSVAIEVDKPDDTNTYAVSTRLVGAAFGHDDLAVSKGITDIDVSLLHRKARNDERLELVTVDNSGRVIGRSEVNVTSQTSSGAVIVGIPTSIIDKNWPDKTEAGPYCRTPQDPRKPTTGPGAARRVNDGCGQWKEFNVQAGEPVMVHASTGSYGHTDARFKLQEKQGGTWKTVYEHGDALPEDSSRNFIFVPESNRVRIKNAGKAGFYLDTYGGFPDVELKAVDTTVETQRIVHDPVVVRYKKDGAWESMVGGASPTHRAVNYAGYANGPTALDDGQSLRTTANFYRCPDHDDQTDTPVETGAALPPDPFDDENDLRSRYRTDYSYYDHYECKNVTGARPPDDADGYVRGDAVSAAVADQPPEWQAEFETMVDPYTADVDDDGSEEFAIDSNQVIVVFSGDDDGDSRPEANDAVLLYTVGEPGTTAATSMLDIRVDVVEFDG